MFDLMLLVFRATVLLATVACLAYTILSLSRCRDYAIHRTTWLSVLAIGVLAMLPFGWLLEVPYSQELTQSEPLPLPVETEFVTTMPIAEMPVTTIPVAETTVTEMPAPMVFRDIDEIPVPLERPYIELSTLSPEESQRLTAEIREMNTETFFAEPEPVFTEIAAAETQVVSSEPVETVDWSARLQAALPWLFAIWTLGMLLYPLQLVRRTLRFQRFLREAIDSGEVDEEWSQSWEKLQRERGVTKTIPLLIVESFGPALVWRPQGCALIVPLEGWDRLSGEERESIMRHELSHYLRNDIFKSILARLMLVPHWFNPFSHFALRRFEEAAEWSCDEAALGAHGEALTVYAKALVSLHESALQKPNLHAAEPVFQHNIFGRDISRRVSRLLSFNAQLSKKESLMKKVLILCCVVLFVAASFVKIQLVAQSEDAGVPAKSEAEHDAVDTVDVSDALEKFRSSHDKISELEKELRERSPEIAAELDKAKAEENQARNEYFFARDNPTPAPSVDTELLEGALRLAEAKHQIAGNDLERAKKLLATGVIPSEELNKSQLKFAEAEYELLVARKALENATTPTPPQPMPLAVQTPQTEIDPDYVALLEKRVSSAEVALEEARGKRDSGTRGGDAVSYVRAEMAWLDARVALLKYLGKTNTKEMIELLEARVKATEVERKYIASSYESGTSLLSELVKAEEKLEEAKYELKKAQKPQVVSPQAISAAAPDPNELRYQGKTFAQWVDEMRTELDPKVRAEAVRAFAMFGAHGRGKDATEAILEAVKGYDFSDDSGQPYVEKNPLNQLKDAVWDAFTPSQIFVPVEDFLPIMMEKAKNGTKNEQYIVMRVLSSLGDYRLTHKDVNRTLMHFFRDLILEGKEPPTGFPELHNYLAFLNFNKGVTETDEVIALFHELFKGNNECFLKITEHFDPTIISDRDGVKDDWHWRGRSGPRYEWHWIVKKRTQARSSA